MRVVTPLTLFEYETAPFEWNDDDLAVLERLRNSLGVAPIQATVSAGKRALRATQYVGVTHLGRCTLQVLPKMYQTQTHANEQCHAADATRNLLFMLTYAAQVPIREQALLPLAHKQLGWFETLTRLYARHLQEEWQRGTFRSYRMIDEESAALRGKWRLDEQLRHPERKHRFSVTYDEFTADNPLNRILRYVVERLWRVTRDADNRRLLGKLREWMDEVQLLGSEPSIDQLDGMINRLNERFRPLLNLARLFLTHQSQLPASGTITGFALLFDMSQLFESFVTQFILRRRAEILPPELADCELLPQSRGATRYLAQSGTQRIALLRPDLLVRERSQQHFPLIIDMKYKRLQPAETAKGIAHSDLLQMHAYAQRYNCGHVLMLYPQTAEFGTPVLEKLMFAGTSQVVTIATLDLRGDLWKPAQQQQLIDRLKTALS